MPANIDRYEPDEINLSAQGPGELVLSEIVYPGWQVWIDGQPGKIETVARVLRGVALSQGNHQITFIYRPWPIYLGIALFLVGLSVIAGITFYSTLHTGQDR